MVWTRGKISRCRVPVSYSLFRCEVGLLTRNILIQGEMEPDCYGHQMCNYFPFDSYGGHLKVIMGFGAAFIENIEFYHMVRVHLCLWWR